MGEKTIFDKINESFKAHSFIDGRYIIIYANETNNILKYNDFRRNLLAIQNEIENKYLRFFNFNFLGDNFLIDTPVVANLEFENCDFEYITKYKTNNNKYAFINCRIYSLYLVGEVDFTLTFQDCKIEKAEIRNCNITSKISFKNSIIENNLYITDSKINQIDCSNTIFKNNAHFNNTKFLDYADFHEAEFNAVAGFYGVTFEKPMNFSSVIFKDFNKVNFVNSNIEKIDFESIETKLNDMFGNGNIEFTKNQIDLKMIDKWIADSEKNKEYAEINNRWQQYLTQKKEKLQKEELEKKEKIKSKFENKTSWANNFRDSFRVIKHSLIETNNNLEASNFHKLELYAKEIELDYTTELEACKRREKTSTDWNWTALKAFFDSHILAFYRNTSEHHTDFIRILNFTITMIALFGIFIFISKISNLEEKVSLFMFFNILISFWLLALSYQFGNTYKNSLFLFYCLFMILPALIFIPELFFKSNIINQCKIIYNNRIVITIGLFYLLILTLVIYWYKNRYFRTFTSFISYPIFFIILYFSVSIILPFANLNSQEFKTKYLENNISQANKTEIIDLASIINLEFNATKNPNSSENLSISELNEYKKFIVENKDKIYDTLSKFNKKQENKNSKKFENFENAIYADSSRDKTIKCISFIYAIILGLCLFSLQKTARRNSVVPS